MNAVLPEVSPAALHKAALAWTHTARFLTTASQLDQLPATELAEIAFVGRSNAGKSTAINMLAQQKRLAFASRTPGRTQHINLFEVGPKGAPNALFADLPDEEPMAPPVRVPRSDDIIVPDRMPFI
ncbi:MAG: GTP-binding protein, partial [Betaproteobacteria bacterium]